MVELLQFFIVAFVVVFAGYAVFVTSMIIDQRNKLRKYTGKYYDFDVAEELKKQNKTADQALTEYNQQMDRKKN